MTDKLLNGCSDHGLPEHFLEKVVAILREEGALDTQSDIPVVNYKSPQQLQESLSLELGSAAKSDAELLGLCREVTHASVKTSHPHFHNQLYGGVDPYGLAGAWISEALNTRTSGCFRHRWACRDQSAGGYLKYGLLVGEYPTSYAARITKYTYEVGPAFTLVENALVQHILKIFGFPEGDAIFAPGGSISNMYAMVLARYKMAPDTKTKGSSCVPPLACFTSEDAHYSALKGAHWLGIGTDNVVRVSTDSAGRMIAEDLDRRIQESRTQGKLPFCVIATAGSTVLGSFDRLDELADVCTRNSVWLHVDACWGGSLMLSKTHQHFLRGSERADSISWNPHKMLGAPLQCSALLVKEKGLLHHCNSASATYLFQQDKFYDVSFDTGDKSVQCGRKVDAFKLWLMWKARGDAGLEQLVDNAMDCARYFRDQIMNRPGFRLVIKEIECTNVCFWFIPKSLRGEVENEDWWRKIHTLAPRLKERLILAGTVMVAYQPMTHKGLGNFFRMVTTCQPPPTRETMDHVIKEIEHYGDLL